MPGIINLNCFDSAACVRCFLCFVSCETTYCCCVFLLQTKVALLFSVYCKRTEFCCVVVASEWCFDDLICCKHTKGFCIVEYCKKSNFGQKTKRENGKKHKHWQKTIQVSNFHNAAETDVNLTGREQVLIQKSRCLFFDGKTVHNLRKYF